eukprot:scaffold241612_cov18-Tisochrysis_lutea.AAC.1
MHECLLKLSTAILSSTWTTVAKQTLPHGNQATFHAGHSFVPSWSVRASAPLMQHTFTPFHAIVSTFPVSSAAVRTSECVQFLASWQYGVAQGQVLALENRETTVRTEPLSAITVAHHEPMLLTWLMKHQGVPGDTTLSPTRCQRMNGYAAQSMQKPTLSQCSAVHLECAPALSAHLSPDLIALCCAHSELQSCRQQFMSQSRGAFYLLQKQSSSVVDLKGPPSYPYLEHPHVEMLKELERIRS